MWDGKKWNNLDIGIQGQVTTMTVDKKNNLWVGGSFNKSGNISCNNVAKWNWKLKIWEKIEGVNSGVAVVEVTTSGAVIMGGSFDSSDSGVELNSIAIYNNLTNKWDNLGANYMQFKPVYAIGIDKKNNLLYVGGYGNLPASVYDFETNTWTQITDANGNQFTPTINTIVVDPNTSNPIFGGTFTTGDANFIPNLHNVVKFDILSSTWIPLNNSDNYGLDSQCYKLFWDHSKNRLIAGGFFYGLTNGVDQGEILNKVAFYDGVRWLNISDGINGSYVESIGILTDGTILFGGSFAGANNQLWSESLIAWTNDYVLVNWRDKPLYTLTNLDRVITISSNDCSQYVFSQIL
jgi:hypothetical protein